MKFFKKVIFLSCFIAFLSSGCIGRNFDDRELKKIIVSGNEIVNAIKSYRKSKGRLPNSLEQLVSLKYLQSIPNTGVDGRRFRYIRFNPIENMEYRISVGLSKPSISSNKIVELTFRSDGKYGLHKAEVHRFIEQWAIQATYR